jgi:hypothetical protein
MPSGNPDLMSEAASPKQLVTHDLLQRQELVKILDTKLQGQAA